MFEERYKRNFPSLSEEEQNILKTKVVTVVGCGGLGGHIIDALARIGVGELRLIDCDVFSESNLNRQLLSTEKNLGKSKAKEAAKRVNLVNSEINVKAINKLLTSANCTKTLKGSDLVIDAVDNIEARFMLEKSCTKLGIYLIHGAVSGWCAQASTIPPGSKFFEKIYPKDAKLAPPSVLSFAPDFAASVQVSEAVKVLLGKDDTLEGKLFIADLRHLTFNIIQIL